LSAKINLTELPNTIQAWDSAAALPDEAKNLVVAIGNFDGVHLGHQAVIAVAQRQAREMGAGLAVLTFSPNPRQFFQPEAPPSELTPLHVRARYLSLLGVQHLYVQNFDLEFSQMEAGQFVEKILVRQLQVRHVVVGDNFHYGHQRLGNVDSLVEQSTELGFGVTPVSPARMADGQVYSSSSVRECLKTGDPHGARQILGRPFEIESVVEHGEALAREWGFPTANMQLGNYLRPKYGVYAVRAAVGGVSGVPPWYNGVANLGVRPTFRGGKELLEVHLFDFDGNLYDQRLRVQLLHYLRPEQKFGKIDDLRAHIAKDAKLAREKLSQ